MLSTTSPSSSSPHRSLQAFFNSNSSMQLFGKRKPKLQATITEAVIDDRAYGKVYDAFAKFPDAAGEAFEFVLHSIVNLPPKAQPKRRNRLNFSSGRLGINASSSTLNEEENIDANIVRSISYLTVLHGIVWSFPKDMATVLKDPENGVVILNIISATYIPLIVRETLLCMVSNWCVLYRDYIAARVNLEGIVDMAKARYSLKPKSALLPDPPFTRGQDNWPYPTSKAKSNGTQGAGPQQIQVQAQTEQQQQYQQQQRHQQQQQQQQQQRQHHTMPMHLSKDSPDIPMASDIVFISQQQEILNSIKPNPQSQLHTQTPQWPSAPTQNSYATANSPSGDKQLSSEFIAHMELSAQELKGICDMLTETLIALNIEEDPVANPVVQDMLSEVKQRKTSLFNFLSMLAPGMNNLLTRLTDTISDADRCLWLYSKTVNSHKEWVVMQSSIKSLPSEEPRPSVLDSTIRSVGSVRSFLDTSGNNQAESSKAAAKLFAATSNASVNANNNEVGSSYNVAGPSGNFVDDRSNDASVLSLKMKGMSSKARGKMAEDPNSNNSTDDWNYSNTDSAYGGSNDTSNFYNR